MMRSACGYGDWSDPEHRDICLSCRSAWSRRNGYELPVPVLVLLYLAMLALLGWAVFTFVHELILYIQHSAHPLRVRAMSALYSDFIRA